MRTSGFADFDRLTELFVRARDVFERVVRDDDLPPESADFLAAAVLPHVELVEEGLRFSLRAADVDLAELRWFVEAAGIGQSSAQGMAERLAALAEGSAELRWSRPTVKQPYGGELTAIEHARLVFGMVPRLPAEAAHWPARWPHADYRDVEPPHRPRELARRIEELERHVWWTAAGRPAVGEPAYRRTFGFFDTGAWLGSQVLGAGA